jgi:hypothetical protein
MRKGIITILLLYCIIDLSAQVNTSEIPFGIRYKLEKNAEATVEIPLESRLLQKKVETAAKIPWYAGYSVNVDIRFSEYATETPLNQDTTIWRMHVHVPDSDEFGIVFSGFEIPEHGKLFIYDQTGRHYIGALTKANNHETGIQSLQPLPAKTLTIEYYSPDASQKDLPQLVIKEIINIVNPGNKEAKSLGTQNTDDCFVNVNCPEGDMWHKQKRGVVRILLREGSDWFYCTGSLLNNTLEDGTPYMLTADHCGEESSEEDFLVWQFLFNYEYSTCDGSTNLPPSNRVITGSTLISNGPLTGGSDFKLLLLNSTPPSSWNPYYNGWSRLGGNPSSGVGIHHPFGTPKKISTYTSPLFNTTFPGGLVSGSWRVVWAETESGHSVTEQGSSGSPLFDGNGLIIGTLSGGASACDFLTSPDVYGKFNRHWTANGTLPEEMLKPWLDPEDENPQVLYGYDPNRATNFVTLSVNPENSGATQGGGYFAQGEVVLLTATPNEDYIFVNWTDEFNQQLSINPDFSFTMPSTEQQITANFRLSQVNNDDLVIGENFFIFPNPANDFIYIRTDQQFENIHYWFFNMHGQLVKEYLGSDERKDHTYIINLSGFQNGLYLLHILLNENVITHKVFVYR